MQRRIADPYCSRWYRLMDAVMIPERIVCRQFARQLMWYLWSQRHSRKNTRYFHLFRIYRHTNYVEYITFILIMKRTIVGAGFCDDDIKGDVMSFVVKSDS